MNEKGPELFQKIIGKDHKEREKYKASERSHWPF